MKRSLSIIGLGYLGAPLAEELCHLGHSVRGTTRSEEKEKQYAAHLADCEILTQERKPSRAMLRSEIIILNIPPFEGQMDWFKSWDWDFSKRIIFVSSTSVYKASSGLVTEDSEREGILADEEDFFIANFPDHLILRSGGILGPGRHPGRILSGRKGISKPHHPVNLIHVEDLRGVIKSFIDSHMKGVFNVVSDEKHSRKDFYTDFCRRNALPLPEFDLKDETLGKRVSNEKLKTFYDFRWPTIFGKDP